MTAEQKLPKNLKIYLVSTIVVVLLHVIVGYLLLSINSPERPVEIATQTQYLEIELVKAIPESEQHKLSQLKKNEQDLKPKHPIKTELEHQPISQSKPKNSQSNTASKPNTVVKPSVAKTSSPPSISINKPSSVDNPKSIDELNVENNKSNIDTPPVTSIAPQNEVDAKEDEQAKSQQDIYKVDKDKRRQQSKIDPRSQKTTEETHRAEIESRMQDKIEAKRLADIQAGVKKEAETLKEEKTRRQIQANSKRQKEELPRKDAEIQQQVTTKAVQQFAANQASWRRRPNFIFPERILNRYKSGKIFTVSLRMTVDEKGNVVKTSIVSSSSNSLIDQAAIKSMRRAKFHPFTNTSGMEVRGYVVLTFDYVVP